MNNQKKKYLKPEIAIIEMVQESVLLCGSCEDTVGTTWDDTEPSEE